MAACADEGGPSFAPDSGTETAVSALTPAPTPTEQVIQSQPGELAEPARTLADLATARGSTASVPARDGDSVTVYDTASGQAATIQLPDPAGIAAATSSPDGGTVLILRRDGGRLTLERIGTDGVLQYTLPVAGVASEGTPIAATPGAATPVAASPASGVVPQAGVAVTRDRMELSLDGSHVAVVSAEGDLSLIALGSAAAPPSIVRVIRDFGDVTALSWSSDGTMAIVGTYDGSRASGSLTGVPLDGRLRSILRLPAGDLRRVIAAVAPPSSADVFFVLRSDRGDFTAQNNLYRIPMVGGSPSVVVATGLAGPAGAVDRLAVADDGRTVAVTILVPRDGDLTFHSLWVTDVETARPLQVSTGSLGLVSRVAWTPDGLFVVGVQRERSESASRLVTVALRLAADGTLAELGRSASAATPVASPVGSPQPSLVGASPVAIPTV